MANNYAAAQWAYNPQYGQNLQLEDAYAPSADTQNMQRSYSDSSPHQQYSVNGFLPPSSSTTTPTFSPNHTQNSRARSADQGYMPDHLHQSSQYGNALGVGNPQAATTSASGYHMGSTPFAYSNSGSSYVSPVVGSADTTGSERIAAPYLSHSPVPFQTSFPPQPTSESVSPARQPYYQHSASHAHPRASLPPTAKRQRPDVASEDEEEPTADSQDDVKNKSRACARCKNLKVKCEGKTDTEPCKRCLNGGHDCITPGKKKRRTPPKREDLMNQIREQAERISDLMSQLDKVNGKAQNGGMSDVSSQSSIPSPAPGGLSPLSPRSSSFHSLEGDTPHSSVDSETNKKVAEWISKAKESFAEFEGFINGGAGAPKSYFVDRDLEESPSEDDEEQDNEYDFAVVDSEGEEWNSNAPHRSKVLRRSSGSSVGSNLTRGSSSGKKKENAVKLATLPNEAVPFGLMANLSLRRNRQRGPSAEVEDVNLKNGVASDDFFSSPGSEPQKARQNEVPMPHILARGIISTSEAEELFQIYFDRMNLSLSLLDPVLYTAQTTCYRSPFMFTVVCAIASRYYTKRPELYDQIIHYAQLAAGSALITGVKNVEMCIGYILLSLFPVPSRNWEDQRGWMYLGLAIRTAMDINLHLPNTAKPMNEMHEREMLNRTRVWLNCFNLDRSTGSQYGKQPIISHADFTASHSENWWCRSSINMKNFDIHISCYTAELQVMQRFISRIYSDPKRPTGLNKDVDLAAISIETDEEFKCLKEKWMTILDKTDMTDPQNRFRTCLLKLAFSYARLVALSFGFQYSFGKNHDNENLFLLRCWTAAYDVVDVTINELGLPEQRIYLRHGPEAQTVFVTFAATFLIKLLQPKYTSHIDEKTRHTIPQLVQGVIDLLGSPEVAVDERHTPKAYSRFLKGLLEVTLAEKAQPQQRTRRSNMSASSSPNMPGNLPLQNHSQPLPMHSAHGASSMSMAPPTSNMGMDTGYGFPSTGMQMDATMSNYNTMQNFLTPDPEYFKAPFPFDEDMMNSIQSMPDTSSASWAIPGFDWMTNYRVPNAN